MTASTFPSVTGRPSSPRTLLMSSRHQKSACITSSEFEIALFSSFAAADATESKCSPLPHRPVWSS